ncbi:unnamed protein product [Amoebophrya sp. A25]|nr:unnamed protein product [Amoebophrya sp. A25]|eukprot:GSA25T00004916001.1
MKIPGLEALVPQKNETLVPDPAPAIADPAPPPPTPRPKAERRQSSKPRVKHLSGDENEAAPEPKFFSAPTRRHPSKGTTKPLRPHSRRTAKEELTVVEAEASAEKKRLEGCLESVLGGKVPKSDDPVVAAKWRLLVGPEAEGTDDGKQEESQREMRELAAILELIRFGEEERAAKVGALNKAAEEEAQAKEEDGAVVQKQAQEHRRKLFDLMSCRQLESLCSGIFDDGTDPANDDPKGAEEREKRVRQCYKDMLAGISVVEPTLVELKSFLKDNFRDGYDLLEFVQQREEQRGQELQKDPNYVWRTLQQSLSKGGNCESPKAGDQDSSISTHAPSTAPSPATSFAEEEVQSCTSCRNRFKALFIRIRKVEILVQQLEALSPPERKTASKEAASKEAAPKYEPPKSSYNPALLAKRKQLKRQQTMDLEGKQEGEQDAGGLASRITPKVTGKALFTRIEQLATARAEREEENQNGGGGGSST